MSSTFVGMPGFPEAAKVALADTQLRRNLAHATKVIRTKRNAVVGELDDWQELRHAGAAIKDRTLRHLPDFLEQFEAQALRLINDESRNLAIGAPVAQGALELFQQNGLRARRGRAKIEPVG